MTGAARRGRGRYAAAAVAAGVVTLVFSTVGDGVDAHHRMLGGAQRRAEHGTHSAGADDAEAEPAWTAHAVSSRRCAPGPVRATSQ